MNRCGIGLTILCFAVPVSSLAQASNSAKLEITRKLIAEEAQARVDMPLGGQGVQLSDQGQIDRAKLEKQIQKNGKSVSTGKIVQVTQIEFGNKSVDVELNGGGKEKKALGGHVQVSVGGSVPQVSQAPAAPKAKGSRITLAFATKVPADLTPEQLKKLLEPVLDFTKRTLASSSIESLPPEFQEAVLAKEARIGMDEETVLLSMGRPNLKTSEKKDGVEQDTWQYKGVGIHRTFVTFENSIVVKITEYE